MRENLLLPPWVPDAVPEGRPVPVKTSWVPIGMTCRMLGARVGDGVGDVWGNIGVSCCPPGATHVTTSQHWSLGSETSWQNDGIVENALHLSGKIMDLK